MFNIIQVDFISDTKSFISKANSPVQYQEVTVKHKGIGIVYTTYIVLGYITPHMSLCVYYTTSTLMGILLYLYPYGYTTLSIPLWVYHPTYTLIRYTALPISLWVYHPDYTFIGILLHLD